MYLWRLFVSGWPLSYPGRGQGYDLYCSQTPGGDRDGLASLFGGVRSFAFSAVTGFSLLSPDVLKMSPNESFHVTDPYNLFSQSHNNHGLPEQQTNQYDTTNLTSWSRSSLITKFQSCCIWLRVNQMMEADLVKFTFSLISTRFDWCTSQ